MAIWVPIPKKPDQKSDARHVAKYNSTMPSYRHRKPPTAAVPAPRAILTALILILIALGATTAYAQETTEEDTWSPPGLPSGIDWTFNFDATFGFFSFGNSLYTDPKPDQPSGDLTANWMEGSLKPALSAEYTTKSSAQFYGKLSGVGMRTYGGSKYRRYRRPTLI
jgi:hypothetical protein